MKGFKKQFTQIRGLSDARRLPRIGKIRLGIKKTSAKGKEYPAEVDYFVCPPEVQAIYGEKPKGLDIMVPVNDLSVVIPQANKWYGKGFGLKCYGDGEKAMRSFGEDGMKETECPCEHLKTNDNPRGECAMVAHFMFILPKINMGGVFQIDTSSINSIINIQSGLEYTAELVNSVTGQYRFNMVPLKLKRIQMTTHGSGKAETHYPLTVEMQLNIDELNAMSTNQKQIPGRVAVKTPKLKTANEVDYSDEENDVVNDTVDEETVDGIPAEFTELTKEEQEAQDESNRVDDEEKASVGEAEKNEADMENPYKMKKVELSKWIRARKGKVYRTVTMNRIGMECFGAKPNIAKITIKQLLAYYERLENEAK